MEERVKKIKDNLTIASITNQRNTRSLSMDNGPTRSLEQTKLQDVQQRSMCSRPNSLRDNIGIYRFLGSGPVMTFVKSFPVFQLVDIQESPEESGDLLMYGVTKVCMCGILWHLVHRY